MKIGDKVKLVSIDKDQRARLEVDDICIGQILEIVDMAEDGELDFGDEFRFYHKPHQFEVVTDDDTKNKGDGMELVKSVTIKEYRYKLNYLELDDAEKTVLIRFIDNKLDRLDHNLYNPYSEIGLEILSMINAKIKELQSIAEEHDKAERK